MGESRIFRFYKTASMLVVALLISGMLLAIREVVSPSDWVDVTVRNVPNNVSQIYLIAEGQDGIQALRWYYSMLTTFTGEARMGENWYWNPPDDRRFGHLQWPIAHRYGGLAQRQDGTWEMWWLDPNDLDEPWISIFRSGPGKAEVRLPDESRATTPSAELLKQLRLPDHTDVPAVP